jgi:hypothetical protein
MIGNPDLEFLLEKNVESAVSVGKYGYSKILNEEFGVECKVEFDVKKYLEFKYRLDKNIC